MNEHPAPVADVDELVAAARAAELGEAVATSRAEPWPNDPYPAGSGVASGTESLRALLAGELSATSVIATLKDSGLRGMGGAGFPTGRKWGLVAAPSRAASSTRSATPTSPSRARSRTGRSWPTSRTW